MNLRLQPNMHMGRASQWPEQATGEQAQVLPGGSRAGSGPPVASAAGGASRHWALVFSSVKWGDHPELL